MYRNAATEKNNKQIIFSRQQGKTAYHFYANEDRIVAEVQKGEIRQETLVINGLPSHVGLKHPNRLQQVQKALEQSYFSFQMGALFVFPRGLGGWGEEQHKGYYDEHKSCGCLPCVQPQLVAFTPKEGTYRWAMELGFLSAEAARIGEQNNAVDSGETNPAPLSIFQLENNQLGAAQQWHFNRYDHICRGGMEQDSRVQLAVAQLKMATAKTKKGQLTEQALNELGKGLHPLQDIFAHTDGFVTKFAISKSTISDILKGSVGELICYSHLTERGLYADEPGYTDGERSPLSEIPEEADLGLSQRYSDAKTATYLYLLCFLETAGLRHKTQFKDPADRIETQLMGVKQAPGRITRNNVIQFHGIMQTLLFKDKTLKVSKPLQSHMREQLLAYAQEKPLETVVVERPGSYLSVPLDDRSKAPISWLDFLEVVMGSLRGYIELESKHLLQAVSRDIQYHKPSLVKRHQLLERFEDFRKKAPKIQQKKLAKAEIKNTEQRGMASLQPTSLQAENMLPKRVEHSPEWKSSKPFSQI